MRQTLVEMQINFVWSGDGKTAELSVYTPSLDATTGEFACRVECVGIGLKMDMFGSSEFHAFDMALQVAMHRVIHALRIDLFDREVCEEGEKKSIGTIAGNIHRKAVKKTAARTKGKSSKH